ncbi:ATP-binding cassette domain-containing protein, partial [Pseudobutyrivibrio sp.]
MIEVNNVTKRFGDFVALDGLNMHVERGAIYGLVGPNGAGKSTIIRHLSGVYKQDEGTVT